MPRKKTREEFISNAIKIYGDRYDYSKVDYINSKTAVYVICPEHGVFSVSPNNHLRGHGCPKCGKEKQSEKLKSSCGEFIIKANKIHNNRYVYSKVYYVNGATKVCITCPKHGDFWQTPHDHLSNHGCPYCAGVVKMDKEAFIKKAREVHGDKYDYSKVDYKNSKKKVIIICPIHGEFEQKPNAHISGKQGCPYCAGVMRMDSDLFIKKAISIHNNIYEYSEVNYKNYKTYVNIICPVHGEFQQTPDGHLHGCGCPKCANKVSISEDEINNFINTECHVETVTRNRSLLGERLECDIIVPSHNFAIEYNGLRWHSEKFGKDKNYHLHKTELAESKGYHLIHIFEDEWLEHKDIVLNKIRHILKCDIDKPVIGARKCVIKTVSKALSQKFFTTYHLQGFSPSTALYGAFFGDKLVGVMTFKKEKEGIWNFNRFATNTDYRLPGLASKMFKQFVKDYDPTEVKAFLDRRWSHCDSNLYDKLGFKLIEALAPDYCYTYKQQRFSKSKFNKQSLAKEHNFPSPMTEKEMAEKLGYYRIWDCGLYKYIWKKIFVKFP